jgi:hypothetical protein
MYYIYLGSWAYGKGWAEGDKVAARHASEAFLSDRRKKERESETGNIPPCRKEGKGKGGEDRKEVRKKEGKGRKGRKKDKMCKPSP